ncbi:MAG TPA: nucleotide-binding protein [Actinomycetota bacterium]|nr:nucleotide-binding protein [Actinomycetota bacterium]
MADPADQAPLPRLTAPRADVERELRSQVSKGHGYQGVPVSSPDDLRSLLGKVRGWNDHNVELLKSRFTTFRVVNHYESVGPPFEVAFDIDKSLAFLRDYLRQKTAYLSTLKKRLDLYDEPIEGGPAPARTELRKETIFVVHGHDRAAELEVLRFLERATDLRPVVLHDEPNRGRTIIEKFEEVAANATYAVVILTPDDEGRAQNAPDLKPRARQNVVFELGFFFGALDRNRVAALYTPEIERPSDIDGVAYIEFDRRGAWKNDLYRELRDADITVHPEALVPLG